MLSLAQIENQPLKLKLGAVFFIHIKALSVNKFFASVYNMPQPALEVLFRVIVKKDALAWVMLKDEIDKNRIWSNQVLYFALSERLPRMPFKNLLILLLIKLIQKNHSHAFLFKALAELNGLISYFDNKMANQKTENEKAENSHLLINFAIIKKILGETINNHKIELNNLYDVLTYPQFQLLSSQALIRALANINAQLVLDKEDQQELSFFERQYKEFRRFMKASFGDKVQEAEWFKPDIEKRAKAGAAPKYKKLYDLFKGVLINESFN